MKTLLALLLIPLSVFAEPVTLSWDASDTPGVTYTVYAYRGVTTAAATGSITPQSLPQSIVASPTISTNAGTNLTVTVDCKQVGLWFFVATAKLDGFESEPSNMASTMISPNKPKNIRRKLLF